MKNKVAIITGAAKGIGLAMAERFAADGARVVINDLDPDGSSVAERLNGLFIEGDLGDPEVCKRIVDASIQQHGTVDILINNAGFQHVESLENFPADVWHKMMAVMLTAPFLLSQHVWPHMKKQKWGRIINITSNSAMKASMNKSAYVAAKHGLLGLTRALALEGGPHGITAHPVCPGLVRTSLIENQIPDISKRTGIPEDEVVDKVFLATAPIKRFIEPSEIAELVHFLCGDAASAMSGSPVLIDLGKGAG
jgi:3-hydroxybutyrate dehydrogenase